MCGTGLVGLLTGLGLTTGAIAILLGLYNPIPLSAMTLYYIGGGSLAVTGVVFVVTATTLSGCFKKFFKCIIKIPMCLCKVLCKCVTTVLKSVAAI